MKKRHAAYIFALSIALATGIPANASSIAITYSLTGMGTVVSSTDTTLTLVGQFSGSVLSADSALNAAWNPITYTDHSVADLTTGLLNGTFSMVFANGDTLSGNVAEDVSAIIASPDGTGPFTQTLTFTTGTGGFAGATGSASGNGFVGTTVGTVSGTGTLNAPAIPEPASIVLTTIGVGLVLIWRKRNRKVLRVGMLCRQGSKRRR
ncbi:MAG: PEP-CTERM sorting domain-containing protein [Acidobacteriaceae bacterium]|nr:PEP-CTERM sorting domain-containing protein [Acidobacteriaceae bacterium]